MSGAAGGSKSNSNYSGGGNFSNYVNPIQQAALADLYGKAGQTYGGANTIKSQRSLANNIGNKVSKASDKAIAYNNSLMAGGQYNTMKLAPALMASLNTSLSNPSETSKIYSKMMGGNGNTYADAMKAAFIGDANRVKDNMLSSLDERAAGAGVSGSSRQGVAQAKGLYDINSNLQHELAQTGYDTFNQDLQNKLGIAQQADSNTLARQQMLETMLGNQVGTQQTAVNNTGNLQGNIMNNFSPYMLPWQNVSNYKNAIGSPTVLSSGQSTNRGSGSSSGKGTSGGVK